MNPDPPNPSDYVVSARPAALEELIRQDAVKHPNRYRLKAREAKIKAAIAAYPLTANDSPTPITRPLPKIGANQPCPCGSGRKYKKCHMRVVEPRR